MDKAESIAEFRKIGLQEGMSVEVHSSLSSFGFVDGGADTVIDALMACLKMLPLSENTASGKGGTFPRAKNSPPDCFCTSVFTGAALSSPV